MRVGTRARLLAATALASAFAGTPGAAEPPTGWYAALDAGGTLHQDGPSWAEFRELGSGPAEPRFHVSPGFVGFARVGYRLTPHLRGELEMGWRSHRMLSIVDQYVLSRPPGSIAFICGVGAPTDRSCGAPSGGLQSFTAMANGYVDLWPHHGVTPFVGGGIGLAHVHLRTVGRPFGTSGPLSPPSTITIDDADDRLAYQAIGGLAVRVNDRLRADLTYRFLDSFSHHWRTVADGPIQLGTISGKYADHAFTLGLRYSFGGRSASGP